MPAPVLGVTSGTLLSETEEDCGKQRPCWGLTPSCLSFPICQIGATLTGQHRRLGRIPGLAPKVLNTAPSTQPAFTRSELHLGTGRRRARAGCKSLTVTLKGRFCGARFMAVIYFS